MARTSGPFNAIENRKNILEAALRNVVSGDYVVLQAETGHAFGGPTVTLRPMNWVQREQGFSIGGAPRCFLHVEETYLIQGSSANLIHYRYDVCQEDENGKVKEILLFHFHPRSEKSNTRWTRQPHLHLKFHEPFQRIHIPTVGPLKIEDSVSAQLALELFSWVTEELAGAMQAS